MPRTRTLHALLVVLWVGQAGAAESWLEVRTEHFAVVSNAGEKTARRTAWELEQARAAYARLWPWATSSPGRPVVALALDNAGTLKRWAPSYYEVKGGIDVVSGSFYGAEAAYLLLRTDARPGQEEITPNFNLYRGYLGLVLAASLERRLPVWLSNGLGAVFGNTFVQDREVQVGRPVPWHFRHFNGHARLRLAAILEAQAGSPLLVDGDQRTQFDAQSYVLVHYLAFGQDGANIKKLNRFIQLWLAGGTHDQAWQEAFGDVAAVEKELTGYAGRSVLTFGRLQADVNIDVQKPPARALSVAQVAALQARVHVAQRRPVEARAALERARAAEPKAPGSYDAEGLLADLQGDRARATRAYGQAAELGSISAYSYFRAAQLSWQSAPDPASLAVQRKHLERALALNDTYAGAQAFLADVLVDEKQAEAALPLIQRAVALEPGDSYAHVVRARVLHALARPSEARQAIDVALRLADSDPERANARRFAQFLADDAAHAERAAQAQAARQGEQACRAGDRAACTRLLDDAEPACTAGDGGACAYAAWLLSEGQGEAADPARVSTLWGRACDLGERPACIQQTWVLLRGEPRTPDKAAVRARLDVLCTRDTFEACTALATLYLGDDKGRSSARVRALLTRACDGGRRDACDLLKTPR